MFGASYNPTKTKLNLKLAITRLGMLQKKNQNQGVLNRKAVAELLKKERVELARIRTEQVIRDDFYMEALEILELYCSLLLTRSGLLDSVKHCHESLQEAVCSVIWAAPRVSVDIKEFAEIKKQFGARFGKEFVDAALQNTSRQVSPRIMNKLSITTPEDHLVSGYMKAIADMYHIDWQPDHIDLLDTSVPSSHFPDAPGAGGDFNGGGGMGLLQPEPAIPNDLKFPSATVPPGAAAPSYHGQAAGDNSQFAFPPQQPPSYNTQAYAASKPPQATGEPQSTGGMDLPTPAAYLPPTADFPTVPQPAAYAPPAEFDPFPSVPSVPGPREPTNTNFAELPQVPSAAATDASSIPDFDDLTRRFERLKQDR
eukprot:m.14394 g.14394  ORF g.14394 m.14394 type:complete len:368 (+) comp10269_c0_seq2:69-1172(+)